MSITPIRKTGPLPSEARYDPLLTNFSVAFWQDLEAFSTREIFPTIEVTAEAGKYDFYPRGAFFRDDVGPRPRGGTSPVTGFGQEKHDYRCEEEGLSTFIDDRDRANTTDGGAKLEKGKVRLLTQQHHTHYERLWADSFFKLGVWSSNLGGVASGAGGNQYLQFDQSGVDPVPFIRKRRSAFKRRTGGFAANAAVMGDAVFRVLLDHPEIRDRIQYSQIGVADLELLKKLLGVDHIAVPGAVWNKAPQGLPEEMEFVIGERDMLLCHRTEDASTGAPTAGVTFAWTGLVPNGGMQASVNRFREERAYSDYFDVRLAVGLKQTAPDLGEFLSDAVSEAA